MCTYPFPANHAAPPPFLPQTLARLCNMLLSPQVKELEEAVQEARKGMHTANLEGSMEEEEVAGDTASGKGKRKQH